jgi:ATP-dependent exoDNAse (exonuclease V) beta subunit
MKRSVRKTTKNDIQMRLMSYTDSISDSIKDLVAETDFSFTEIQRMINENFFDDQKDNVEDVFGELEEVDSDDADEKDDEEDTED